jgi:hypothetical protein
MCGKFNNYSICECPEKRLNIIKINWKSMIYSSLRTHYGLDLSYVREYKREKYRPQERSIEICGFSALEFASNLYIKTKVS